MSEHGAPSKKPPEGGSGLPGTGSGEHRSANGLLDSFDQFGYLLKATESLRFSPVHDHMKLSVVRQDAGVATLSMPLTENVRGFAPGSVHGGMLATLADAACAMCLEGCYESGGQIPVTTDMHIRYYRQPSACPLTAEATMVHRGRKILSTECSIVDGAARVLARATASYMIVAV
jgi:uncharacterized protein (TIGR00369 family)